MKRNFLRRALALVMVFAMTLSLASMALAADASSNVEVLEPSVAEASVVQPASSDTSTGQSETTVSDVPADTQTPGAEQEPTAPVEEDQSTEGTTDPVEGDQSGTEGTPEDGTSSAEPSEEETPTDTPEDGQTPTDTPENDGEEVPVTDPADGSQTEETPLEDGELSMETETDLWAAAGLGWVQEGKSALNNPLLQFYYKNAAGAVVQAKDSSKSDSDYPDAYQLTQSQMVYDTVNKQNITLPAGIYYFSSSGNFKTPSGDCGNYTVHVIGKDGVETGTKNVCVKFTKQNLTTLTGWIGEVYEQNGWVQDGKSALNNPLLQFYYQDTKGGVVQAIDTYKSSGDYHDAYQITTQQTVYDNVNKKNITLPAGIYYFSSSANLKTPASACTSFTVHVIGANGVETGTKNLCVKFTKINVGTFSCWIGDTSYKGGFMGLDGKAYYAGTGGVILMANKVESGGAFSWAGDKLYRFTQSSKNSRGEAVGAAYTGCVKITKAPESGTMAKITLNQVYYFSKGVCMKADDSYHWFNSKLYYFDNSEKYNGWSVGKLYTGSHKFGSLPTALQGKYKTGVVYYMSKGVGIKDDKSYHWYNGKLYYFNNSSKYNGMSVGTAYSGVHYCGSIPASVKNYTAKRWYVFKNGAGTLLTGVYNRYYCKNGVTTATNGWVKYDGDYYYFKNSKKCITGDKVKLKGIGNTSKYYYYYFKSDGSVWTNLFSKSAAYKANKMQIKVDDGYHNAMFLLYNGSTKSYDIAALQVICSTPSKRGAGKGLSYGTYNLSCAYRHSWLQNLQQSKWYAYCTNLNTTDNKATGYMFHSPQYYRKNDYYSLVTANYNKFGNSNTGGCLRLQTGYVALVYSISQKNTYPNVEVLFNKYNDKGPFGVVKNADIQIPSSQKYDPTTPSGNL